MARELAITIHGPWAWAIMAGHKRVENRTWGTSHRGRLWIHAGVSRASDEAAEAMLRRLSIAMPDEWPRGVVLGSVTLDDCAAYASADVTLRRDPFAVGPCCWLVDRPACVDPIPCAGKQGLWDISLLLHAHGLI